MYAQVSEYHKLKLEIAQLEKKIMSKIMRPEIILYFLVPGRLVSDSIHQHGNDFELCFASLIFLQRLCVNEFVTSLTRQYLLIITY